MLPSKATHSIFSTNKVTSSKKTKHMIAHAVSAEMGIEPHWILRQCEGSSMIPYGNTLIERNQLLKPHWRGLWEQNESVGKTGDMTHLACMLASKGSSDE